MSLDYAILGFLSFKPLSGYDLKKAFDQSVQHFWPANQSQIYRTLARLEEKGLVEHEVIEREGPLDIKAYHLTTQGEESLYAWLSTPLPLQDYRDPFLIKVFFGGKLSDQELLRVIEAQEKPIKDQNEVFRGMLDNYQKQMVDDKDRRALFVSCTTLEFGLLTNETVLKWLESVKNRIKKNQYHFIKSINKLKEQNE